MASAVKAICPGCKKIIRIPAELLDQPVRCRHCMRVVRLKSARTATGPAAAAQAQPVELGGKSVAAQNNSESIPLVHADPLVRTREYLRQARRRKWLGLAAVCFFGIVALTGFLFRDRLGQLGRELTENTAVTEESGSSKNDGSKTHPPAGIVFPRRALAICVSNYLYANPVSYGDRGHNIHSLMDRVGRSLHVPYSQLFEVSDAGVTISNDSGPSVAQKKKGQEKKPSLARPPLKAVVEEAIVRFFETSRPQDRIVLLFCGHAVVIGSEAYLVPLDGDFTAKDTLIPFAWLYNQLQKCLARQKLLILDTCRLDPTAGLERPGSGPMSDKLDEILQKPPAGVQVWSSCVKGQYSYEIDGTSVFLEKLQDSLMQKVLKNSDNPEDSLPLDAFVKTVTDATSSEVESRLKAKQTPRITGQAADDGVAFDPHEPEPPKIELSQPGMASADAALRSDIQNILKEIDLPPIKLPRDQAAATHLELIISFAAKTMEAYKPDYSSVSEIESAPDKFPLRVAILKVVKLLNDEFSPEKAPVTFRESFAEVKNERVKAEILKEQTKPAKVLLDLQEALDALRKVGEKRDQEPSKRWQAHYDYVRGQLLARIAYVSEYNLMLGKIRKDELPELSPGQTGYRLSSQEKLQSSKEVKEMAAESKKILAKLAKDHAGTPWEVLGKRAQVTTLGLKWEPTR
jgi:hypothetical protein